VDLSININPLLLYLRYKENYLILLRHLTRLFIEANATCQRLGLVAGRLGLYYIFLFGICKANNVLL